MRHEILADATLNTLAVLPSKGCVSLVVRHSLRDPILGDNDVYMARLTPQGKASARQFGRELAHIKKLGRLISSPVSRCVDTALAISEGAGYGQLVRVDDRLSHTLMAPIWNALPACGNFDAMPSQIVTLLDLLVPRPGGDGCVDIFITHDTVVGALAGYITCEPVKDEAIPLYLEGFFIWQDEKDIHFWWRGKNHVITTLAA
jgi:Histidine phosphatase superfamily (branch 1)